MGAASRITIGYLILACLWIAGSDWLFSTLFPAAFPIISLYKGWGYVLVTGALLYGLLRREEAKRDAIEHGLREMAIYDRLTGLLNRACLVENLERAVARAEREGTELGVLFVDLDGFKEVNDRHGHQVGDELLIEVAGRLRQLARTSDSVARFGGDEFLLLAPAGRQGTDRLAERLVQALREPVLVRGLSLNVSASVGYALYPEHGAQAEQLIRAADMAMYQSKCLGKDQAVGAEILA